MNKRNSRHGGLLASTAVAMLLLTGIPGIAVSATDSEKPAQTSTRDMADGEVRKLDRENGKLTLRHGEIKNLGMPPMTMVFTVRNKALLEAIKPGDKVRFSAIHEPGVYVVTDIRVIP